MNIIKEQNDNLSMQVKISIEELDYNDRVKKELNKMRVKAQMPGFRQGHVPFGLVQKMYGQAVLAEEINKILQESVGKFLEDEKIDLLGAPFPAQDSPHLDFEYGKDFDFTLNIILSPEVNIDFLPTLPTTYYKIKATDTVIDEQIAALCLRFGTKDSEDSEVIKEAKINEELFAKAFPHRGIKTEKELRKVIAEEHSEMCAETVKMWYFNTCFDPIIAGANLKYDDQMLRQLMEYQKHIRREESEQDEEVTDNHTVSDEEFEKTKKGTSWQLIQQKMMTTYDIKVEPDEIKQEAKEQISRYFGVNPKMMDDKLGDYMNSMVDNVMKDQNQLQELYSRALDKKIVRVLMEKTQMTTKEVTWDEFLKIVDAKKEETDAPAPKKTRRSPAPKSKKEKSE
ncbi:MAG: hypothetical protein FWF09_06470 [Bacteroidales bacterium]|nr:hypothetical protein [Bacteroidales bacterium]